MRELSLNVLDIAENSFKAKAKTVEVSIIQSGNVLTISIKDDGVGMDEEFLKRVVDPFTTTRTTRKVGMGIPLFKMVAEQSGGTFDITSEVGVGTTVTATFMIDNVDRPPLGDIADTIVSMIGNLGDSELIFNFQAFGESFTLDTNEVKRELENIPINTPEILVFLRDMINENIKTNCRGVSL